MELSDSLKSLFVDTAQMLKGHARRRFMAQTVKELGSGGQRRAERELGWNRETIRKGMCELESGLICLDNFAARGRKPAEAHLPNLPCPAELVGLATLTSSVTHISPLQQAPALLHELSTPFQDGTAPGFVVGAKGQFHRTFGRVCNRSAPIVMPAVFFSQNMQHLHRVIRPEFLADEIHVGLGKSRG